MIILIGATYWVRIVATVLFFFCSILTNLTELSSNYGVILAKQETNDWRCHWSTISVRVQCSTLVSSLSQSVCSFYCWGPSSLLGTPLAIADTLENFRRRSSASIDCFRLPFYWVIVVCRFAHWWETFDERNILIPRLSFARQYRVAQGTLSSMISWCLCAWPSLYCSSAIDILGHSPCGCHVPDGWCWSPFKCSSRVSMLVIVTNSSCEFFAINACHMPSGQHSNSALCHRDRRKVRRTSVKCIVTLHFKFSSQQRFSDGGDFWSGYRRNLTKRFCRQGSYKISPHTADGGTILIVEDGKSARRTRI